MTFFATSAVKAREDRLFDGAVFAGADRRELEHQPVGHRDPPPGGGGLPGLRSEAETLLVNVAPRERLELADAHPGLLEHPQRKPPARGRRWDERVDVGRARGVDDGGLFTWDLHSAIRRWVRVGGSEVEHSADVKLLALGIPERETILAALDDPPDGLGELRAVLLRSGSRSLTAGTGPVERLSPAAYSGRGERVLHCEQCGCSGELGMGWVTFVRADADEGDDTPWTGAYCPPCAAARFGYQPDVAENYVCVWNPIEAETAEGPKLQEEAKPPRQPRRRRRRRRRTKR